MLRNGIPRQISYAQLGSIKLSKYVILIRRRSCCTWYTRLMSPIHAQSITIDNLLTTIMCELLYYVDI